jgi:hemolysin III
LSDELIEKRFPRLREPFNGLSHLGAAFVAIFGLILLLLVGWGSPGKTLALGIYGASLVLQFTASGFYHSIIAGPQVIEMWRKLDHAAIYFLIAGTYTPICTIMLTGFWQWGLLVIIWSLAMIGILVKMFIIKAPRWLTAGVYVAMGWLCLAGVGEMAARLPLAFLLWLLVGGLIYTVGAVIYVSKKLDFIPGVFGFHEVWHIFVILGALAHYIAILLYVAPA